MSKLKTGIITFNPTDNVKEMQLHTFLQHESLISYDLELRKTYLEACRKVDALIHETLREVNDIKPANMNCPLRGGIDQIVRAHTKFEQEVEKKKHDRHNKDFD